MPNKPRLSRLRKAIIQGHRDAYNSAGYKEYQTDYGVPPDSKQRRNLPYPHKLNTLKQFKTPMHASPCPPATVKHGGEKIISDSKNPRIPWEMTKEHRLWVRIFNARGDVMYNHSNSQRMRASQMIQLCTKLINHLNMISKTGEMDMQEALGTLEETITAQLTPPLDSTAAYHSWNLREHGVCYDVGAIAIIRQLKDDSFKGQLIDDIVDTTFQLQ